MVGTVALTQVLFPEKKLQFPFSGVDLPTLNIRLQHHCYRKDERGKIYKTEGKPILFLKSGCTGQDDTSSSYCRASVANAPNVLQPYWLIVLPLDVPALTTSLLYEILAARG
jgi:hypothetical protein